MHRNIRNVGAVREPPDETRLERFRPVVKIPDVEAVREPPDETRLERFRPVVKTPDVVRAVREPPDETRLERFRPVVKIPDVARAVREPPLRSGQRIFFPPRWVGLDRLADIVSFFVITNDTFPIGTLPYLHTKSLAKVVDVFGGDCFERADQAT